MRCSSYADSRPFKIMSTRFDSICDITSRVDTLSTRSRRPFHRLNHKTPVLSVSNNLQNVFNPRNRIIQVESPHVEWISTRVRNRPAARASSIIASQATCPRHKSLDLIDQSNIYRYTCFCWFCGQHCQILNKLDIQPRYELCDIMADPLGKPCVYINIKIL